MVNLMLKSLYYLFYDLLKIFRNLKNDKQFIILLPRIFFSFLNKIVIYDKKNKNIFFQKFRNKFDILTIYEIFSEQDYNINWYLNNNKKTLDNKKNLSKVIIDCGSNIGSSIEFFSRVYNPSKIIGVEPDLVNVNFSKKNISNKFTSIINKAISDKRTTLHFDNSKDDNRSFNIINSSSGVEVETITVNDIIKDLKKDHDLFLLKIDIEGHEDQLFKENFDWIDEFKIIIIEIHDWMLNGKANSKNFIDALSYSLKKNKRDLLISGENLISIKINE